jgi:hypothetical protein
MSSTSRDEEGGESDKFRLRRGRCLLGAATVLTLRHHRTTYRRPLLAPRPAELSRGSFKRGWSLNQKLDATDQDYTRLLRHDKLECRWRLRAEMHCAMARSEIGRLKAQLNA